MKLKLNTLAGLLVLAFAGQASAAVTLGSAPGGSSLILSVWDLTTNESYTRNLGTNLNGFLPSGLTTLPNDGNVPGTAVTGDKTPSTGLNLSFAGDALFTSTFGNNSPANVQWNIVAFDQVASTGSGLTRVITTVNGTAAPTNSGMGTMTQGGNNYLNALVAQTTLGGGDNSVVVTDPVSQAFAGNDNWGDALNLNLNGSSSGLLGATLDFFYFARTQISGLNSTAATSQQYSNGAGNGTWTLAADGTATYTIADEGGVSQVPVPAAAWLLASGLVMGLKSVRRRKSAAAAA